MDGDRKIYKVSLLGDLFTGKSTLIEVLKTRQFYEIKFSVAEKHWLELKGKRLEITEIVPCFGESIETVQFDKTEAFILCYSVNVRSSYANIEYWNSRIDKLQPNVPKILVGEIPKDSNVISNVAVVSCGIRRVIKRVTTADRSTKIDTRPAKPNPSRYVSKEEGMEMMNRIKADHFVECSSKQVMNVDLVFEQAVQTVRIKDKKDRIKPNKCKAM